MSSHFRRYKRIFRRHLQPVFALLVSRRKGMDISSWKALVRRTLKQVANNPVEYLGNDLPSARLITDILDEIQYEFFKDVIDVRS